MRQPASRRFPLPLLFVVLVPALASPVVHADVADDLAVVEARVLASLQGSGRRLSYPGAEHLTEARVRIHEGKTAEALAALDAWLDLEYRHSNWWVNHVPIPRAVGEIALLLRDDLGVDRTTRVERVLRWAWPPPRGGIGVGANLFYRVDAGVLHALLLRDAKRLQGVMQQAAQEIRITVGEGIQEDMSFLQHGPQLYTGSYGLEYIRGAIRVMELGQGTGLALSPERRDLLLSLVLDGLQWMVHGPMIDPGAQGRNFSRTGAGRGGRTVRGFVRELLALGVPRAEELETFAESLSGNRYFWRGELMVHRRPGWYVSTKMVSKRTVGTESGNGEGLKQYHLADGACIVLRRGDEYDGIQPVWNWRRVPGTTCEQTPGSLPLINWGRGARGTTTFVGGVSDGDHGVAVMHLDKAGVRARKAWFHLGDQTVCLGAGIHANGEHAVVTTLNQCLARSPVHGGDAWVHHDGVGYVVLDGTLEQRVAEQEGSWKSINRGLSGAPVEKNVFSAWIDHGPKPDGATYAYVVLPGASVDRTEAYAARPAVRILANTEAVQAVRHEGLGITGIAFHEPGAIAGVRVSRPCVVLVGGSTISVADPAQRNQPVMLALAGRTKPLVFEPREGRTHTRSDLR